MQLTDKLKGRWVVNVQRGWYVCMCTGPQCGGAAPAARIASFGVSEAGGREGVHSMSLLASAKALISFYAPAAVFFL
jgi:hypothetical protein